MLDPIDPVFEQALREALGIFKELLREQARIERVRIRKIVESHEDDDPRPPGVLVDQILEEIGGDD